MFAQILGIVDACKDDDDRVVAHLIECVQLLCEPADPEEHSKLWEKTLRDMETDGDQRKRDLFAKAYVSRCTEYEHMRLHGGVSDGVLCLWAYMYPRIVRALVQHGLRRPWWKLRSALLMLQCDFVVHLEAKKRITTVDIAHALDGSGMYDPRDTHVDECDVDPRVSLQWYITNEGSIFKTKSGRMWQGVEIVSMSYPHIWIVEPEYGPCTCHDDTRADKQRLCNVVYCGMRGGGDYPMLATLAYHASDPAQPLRHWWESPMASHKKIAHYMLVNYGGNCRKQAAVCRRHRCCNS